MPSSWIGNKMKVILLISNVFLALIFGIMTGLPFVESLSLLVIPFNSDWNSNVDTLWSLPLGRSEILPNAKNIHSSEAFGGRSHSRSHWLFFGSDHDHPGSYLWDYNSGGILS